MQDQFIFVFIETRRIQYHGSQKHAVRQYPCREVSFTVMRFILKSQTRRPFWRLPISLPRAGVRHSSRYHTWQLIKEKVGLNYTAPSVVPRKTGHASNSTNKIRLSIILVTAAVGERDEGALGKRGLLNECMSDRMTRVSPLFSLYDTHAFMHAWWKVGLLHRILSDSHMPDHMDTCKDEV